MYPWILFLHVLSGFIFMMSHGAAAIIAFRLKGEDDPNRIQALLNVSSTSWLVFMISFLGLLIAGIALGFMGRWWGEAWIWISLALLIAMGIIMGVMTQRHYHSLRKVVGLPYMEGNKEQPAGEVGSQQEIQAVIELGRPWLMALIGGGGWALILWLMIFKPF